MDASNPDTAATASDLRQGSTDNQAPTKLTVEDQSSLTTTSDSDARQKQHSPQPLDTSAVPHHEDSHSYQPPTPGEEMTFDGGRLYVTRANAPPMPRNNSYPEQGTQPHIRAAPQQLLHPQHHPLDPNGRPHSHYHYQPTASSSASSSSIAESRSVPIHLPSEVQQQQYQQQQQQQQQRGPYLSSPGQPAPQGSRSTSSLNGSPHDMPTSRSNPSLYRQFNNNGSNSNLSSRPYTHYSTPRSALRPDSVCSYPDSSPLMAPNVLAAMEARLRASASNSSLNSNRTTGQGANGLTPHSTGAGACASPRSLQNGFARSVHSRASSVMMGTGTLSPPTVTHHQVLETSDAIKSREQLYDLLNKDDDNVGDMDMDNDETAYYDSAFHLGKPNPKFRAGSAMSSRRSSMTMASSAGGGSDIELNVTKKCNARNSVAAAAAAAGIVAGADAAIRPPSRTTTPLSSAAAARDFDEKDFIEPIAAAPKSAWLKSKSRNSRKWKGVCCVVGILALVAVVAGIALGFVLRKGKVDGLARPPEDPTNPTSPGGGGNGGGGGGRPVPPLITQFPPDPNLSKAFYGVAYNPAKVLMPWCGADLQSIINDINLMSQITKRIRLYGMDCGQADLTFQAIKILKVQMEVVLTIWVDNNSTTYQRQKDTLFKVLDTYGTDMLTGVSVGNEVLFRKDMDLTTLGGLMSSVRSELKTRYNKAIPVFTSDVGSDMTPALASYSDMLQGNLHPYFSGTTAAMAANWTFTQYEEKIVENPVSSGTAGVISEVGWPSAPSSAVYLNGSIPGLANLQTVVDTFVCQANTKGIPYYWFEFKDEPWKIDPDVPVEPYWGIFDKDGKLKIKIPDCIAP
ncbi:hypothetical protein EMPS_01302 [Entomortierella parvispora]|uniref:glucan endo-1,3-beta-D-glucosidase n=1 Tax=Entomortierella parvispora TaxID=205924 RepID=A0A9P3H2J8_9FUNG|nr:hypothetical protein EMPS_01302 [Entomortierella parvispora]